MAAEQGSVPQAGLGQRDDETEEAPPGITEETEPVASKHGQSDGSHGGGDDLPSVPASPSDDADLFGTADRASPTRTPPRGNQPMTTGARLNAIDDILDQLRQSVDSANAFASNAMKQAGQAGTRVEGLWQVVQEAEKERRAIGNHIDMRLVNLERLGAELRQKMQEHEDKMAAQADQGGRDRREKQAMTDRRGIGDRPTLSEEAAGYSDWVFKVKAFVRPEEGFEKYLEFLDNFGRQPTVADIDEYGRHNSCDARWFDEQLYGILVHRAQTDSKAISVTKNCLDFVGCRGARSWFDIALECKGGKGQLRQDTLRDAAPDWLQRRPHTDPRLGGGGTTVREGVPGRENHELREGEHP